MFPEPNVQIPLGRDGQSGRGLGGGDRGGGLAGGGDLGAGCAVPVGLGVLEALADSDALPAFGLDETEVVGSQVSDGLLDDVVLDGEPVRGTDGALAEEGVVDHILSVLDLRWQRVEVVGRVQVEERAVVAEGFHVRPAAARLAALRIRWTHVGWVLSNNIGNGTFILHHLLDSHR